MHNKVQITLDGGEAIEIPISVMLSHLDHSKVKILSPSGHPASIESHNIEHTLCLAAHQARMNEVKLNHALKIHTTGLHSSFQSEFILSRSGQVVNMPLFPKLDLCLSMHRAHKINRTIPVPGEAERTKNSARLGRNVFKVAPDLAFKLEVHRKHYMTTRYFWIGRIGFQSRH